MITSKPLYVYLQRPDNGEWVTVGRYRKSAEADGGKFRYAPSYAEAGLDWSVDPAFDVVPNPLETPHTLALQLSAGRCDISRDAALADAPWQEALRERLRVVTLALGASRT
jgi:serine/threonine-protein kinase HipA